MSLIAGYCFNTRESLVGAASAIVASNVQVAQFYSGNPQGYFPGNWDEAEKDAMLAVDVRKFVHMNFLVNVAVAKGIHRKSIFENLKFLEAVGGEGLIVHNGANEDIEDGLLSTMRNLEGFGVIGRKVLIENTCGGVRIPTERLLKIINYSGARLCLDTAHAFAEGIVYERLLEILTTVDIGLVHLNNPSPDVAFGSGRDKHNCSLFDPEAGFTEDQIVEMAMVCSRRNIPVVLETGDEVVDYERLVGIIPAEAVA